MKTLIIKSINLIISMVMINQSFSCDYSKEFKYHRKMGNKQSNYLLREHKEIKALDTQFASTIDMNKPGALFITTLMLSQVLIGQVNAFTPKKSLPAHASQPLLRNPEGATSQLGVSVYNNMTMCSLDRKSQFSTFNGMDCFGKVFNGGLTCSRTFMGLESDHIFRKKIFSEETTCDNDLIAVQNNERNDQLSDTYFSVYLNKVTKLNGFDINCFGYALTTFGARLEVLTGMAMLEIQNAATRSDGTDDFNKILEEYFVRVDSPQDGDLVVYQAKVEGDTIWVPEKWTDGKYTEGKFVYQTNTEDIYKNSHAGIYRILTDKQHLGREVVESKWGWDSKMVIRHSIFNVPQNYGNEIQFYRLRNT